MKVLKDKCGKWYFVSRPIVLPWAHGEILVLSRKSEVFLSSAEKWYPALEVAVSEVSGCACHGTSESGLGLGEISIFSALKETIPDTKADHERAQKGPPFQWDFSVTLETSCGRQIVFCDNFPTKAFCRSFNTLVLESA